MKALKILVIVMGVMLVVGFAVLVVAIADRLAHPRSPAPIAAPTVMAPGGERRAIDLPAGAAVLAAQSDGDRVMLRLRLADGGEELILLDWKTGARLGTLDLRAGSEAAKP